MRKVLFSGIPMSIPEPGEQMHDIPQGKVQALQNLSTRP
jgi:hypothetical protein